MRRFNYRCQSCLSTNTVVGIAPDSTNVSFICNHCNFRDVIFYGDSRSAAFIFWRAIALGRSRKPSRLRRRARVGLFYVRFASRESAKECRWNVALLVQRLWKRVGQLTGDSSLNAREYLFLMQFDPCKR